MHNRAGGDLLGVVLAGKIAGCPGFLGCLGWFARCGKFGEWEDMRNIFRHPLNFFDKILDYYNPNLTLVSMFRVWCLFPTAQARKQIRSIILTP